MSSRIDSGFLGIAVRWGDGKSPSVSGYAELGSGQNKITTEISQGNLNVGLTRRDSSGTWKAGATISLDTYDITKLNAERQHLLNPDTTLVVGRSSDLAKDQSGTSFGGKHVDGPCTYDASATVGDKPSYNLGIGCNVAGGPVRLNTSFGFSEEGLNKVGLGIKMNADNLSATFGAGPNLGVAYTGAPNPDGRPNSFNATGTNIRGWHDGKYFAESGKPQARQPSEKSAKSKQGAGQLPTKLPELPLSQPKLPFQQQEPLPLGWFLRPKEEQPLEQPPAAPGLQSKEPEQTPEAQPVEEQPKQLEEEPFPIFTPG